MSAINSLAALLEAAKPPVVAVEVLGLGSVRLRALLVSDRLELQAMEDDERSRRIGPFLVCRSLVDDKDVRLLADTEEDQIQGMSGSVISDMVVQIMRLNRLADFETDDAIKN